MMLLSMCSYIPVHPIEYNQYNFFSNFSSFLQISSACRQEEMYTFTVEIAPPNYPRLSGRLIIMILLNSYRYSGSVELGLSL